ncbi:TetR/AcrR family transcriptional regulator [Saccharibacillus deserti]|uniref:TetR/AcrR family transcriptional regulator n=1 Tax=Saccharibacillus deserti TaxID=1634444 RepID=UPI001555B362|nr:TetR/AcrR family transcriptional regulator [Saccharibacillus deserti]
MKKNPRKKQIVDAAARTIAEKGYDSASIKEIAAEAGLAAHGLIHYYFKTKEDILHEVLRRSRERCETEFGEPLPDDSAKPLFETEPARTRTAAHGHEADWYKLRYELFAQGLRSPQLAGEVGELLEIGRSGIAGVLDASLRGIEDGERDSLSAILLSCFDGLALQKLLNPELDLEKAYGLLETMILNRFSSAD